MSSRRRLRAAARGEPVDRIPVSPRLGWAVIARCGENTPMGQLRLRRKVYDFDIHMDVMGNRYPFVDPFATYRDRPGIRVEMSVTDEGPVRIVDRTIGTPDGPLHEVFKVPNPGRMEYGLSPNPVRLEHAVKSADDLDRVAHLLPEPDASPADAYRNLEAVLGEDGLVRCCVYGPIDHQAGELMPPDEMMVLWLTDRPFVERLVGMFWRQIMAQTRLLLEAGVRTFFTPWYWHSLSVGWGPRIFREWFLPMISELVSLIHAYDGLAFYYDDGRMMGIVPMLVEAGVDVVETCTPPPVGDFDLERAVREWGPRITFLGHTDLIYVLQRGSVEDVRRTVQRSCEIGRRGRFILGTTDGIREGTPLENIDAFFRYGREYGRIR